MDFFPKVVASVASLDDAREAVRLGADMIEVRVDLASEDPPVLVEKIFRLGKPIIVTIRPAWEGGSFRGDDAERLELFRKLIPLADYVDVELRAGNVDEIVSLTEGSDAMAIVSYHDFERTPSNGEMLDIISRCLEKGDIAKLAVMPGSLGDALRLFEVTLASKRPVCTMAMGDIGAHSRIVAPLYGSVFSYGYVREPVAPGQMRVDRIIEGLRLLGLR
ncbi:3-dehydroquinate dehydratase, type I [Methanocella conradii HZ254]|uniref:3-dehydroquinate dehydratase n=1 Tax=Methanocella conradii (strain DSM 24694 / JCM 17849 / CGMCC 1.5162 / HZ254) TaxID=1041930 RepID=H8I6J5_METCZ|nr:type I 3-dehydroquinate dehydratase [Methanocella conradii]AFC98887.1 3-dehydroquinate dehydratase, type I [Methanocella conradii HZ254]MDI6897221.1 type I 3-dehydroquinate dehydratase [Methanocella conradii]